ncbi:hypothetical protein GCM10009804_07210 [Kribbella hippodromi]|uniref:Uncharacterized protein n=1 Tax=Kribbella hippodromi TaxID=434347 RepID=A0ABN2CAC0_9ACTN
MRGADHPITDEQYGQTVRGAHREYDIAPIGDQRVGLRVLAQRQLVIRADDLNVAAVHLVDDDHVPGGYTELGRDLLEVRAHTVGVRAGRGAEVELTVRRFAGPSVPITERKPGPTQYLVIRKHA